MISLFKMAPKGIPWRSRGWDSALSLPRAQVRSLVGELRPTSSAAKKKKAPMSAEVSGVLSARRL